VRTSFVAALCTLFAPAVVRAQAADSPSHVRLVVPAREGCPTLARVRDDLQRRLGRDAIDDAAPRELAVDFIPTPSGWNAWIVVTATPTGRRTVRVIERQAARCDALADAVGVALTLAVDADAPEPAPAACPACPEPAAPAAPPPPAAAPLGRDDERPSPPPPRPTAVAPAPAVPASLTLLGGVAFGFQSVAPQWGLQVRTARWRWLQATLGFRSVVAVEHRDGDPVLGLAAGNAGACLASGGATLRGGVCAGLEVGATHAIVPDPSRPRRGDRLWMGLFASAYGRARVVGPVFVSLEGRLAVTTFPDLDEGPDPRRAPFLPPSRLVGDLSLGVGVDL
jgi:hypothetical protein